MKMSEKDLLELVRNFDSTVIIGSEGENAIRFFHENMSDALMTSFIITLITVTLEQKSTDNELFVELFHIALTIVKRAEAIYSEPEQVLIAQAMRSDLNKN